MFSVPYITVNQPGEFVIEIELPDGTGECIVVSGSCAQDGMVVIALQASFMGDLPGVPVAGAVGLRFVVRIERHITKGTYAHPVV